MVFRDYYFDTLSVLTILNCVVCVRLVDTSSEMDVLSMCHLWYNTWYTLGYFNFCDSLLDNIYAAFRLDNITGYCQFQDVFKLE